MAVHAQIILQGIVQGVGFRPFVYRLAGRHAVTGYVVNTVSGVIIEAEGPESAVSAFIRDLTALKPRSCRIDEIQVRKNCRSSPGRLQGFTIAESLADSEGMGLLPPDLDVCPLCLEELFTAGDRRHHYPFINCTDCGPRYTIIENLPFDRSSTAMKDFSLCLLCDREYRQPTDRRFHAQAICCPECGPQLELTDTRGRRLPCRDPVAEAAAMLIRGEVVAVKGLGGFHLAVDARDEKAVARLRQRKARPHKPLAVMAAHADAAREFAMISDAEEKWLTGREKPIVLLRQRSDHPLATNLAPGQRFIGVMLPYTPLHHLLLASGPFPALVMTSGNRAGEPIARENGEAAERLSGIADGFLWHDRPIVVRNDDSVLKLLDGMPVFLRRSRSFAPLPILLPGDYGRTLALGGVEKNTICLTRGRHAYLSQHLGDLDSPAGLENFRSVIYHLRNLLRIEPELVAHDLHPDYPSTRYASSLGLPRVSVQHHHAHAVSCMAEHGLNGPVLAIVLDGSGYGTDSTIWGGEVLRATLDHFDRLAHFTPFPMPGGEAAVRQPWRLAVAQLFQAYGREGLELDLPVLRNRKNLLAALEQMLEKNINAPLTSSCGRLFDAVAALTGVRESITYEGQAAVELEMLITGAPAAEPYQADLERAASGCWQMNFSPMIREIVTDLYRGATAAQISNRFHQTIACVLQAACRRLRDLTALDQIVLSGGVFQNLVLLARLTGLLTADGFTVYTHQMVPPNDGGLALGQAVAGPLIHQGETHGVA